MCMAGFSLIHNSPGVCLTLSLFSTFGVNIVEGSGKSPRLSLLDKESSYPFSELPTIATIKKGANVNSP